MLKELLKQGTIREQRLAEGQVEVNRTSGGGQAGSNSARHEGTKVGTQRW
jgi:hypothetical protein